MGSRISTYSVELVKESSKVYDVSRRITCPKDAYTVIESVMGLSKKTKEHFVMLSLNSKNEAIGVHTIHIGTINQSFVHPKDVLQQAILNNAAAFMVFHNHPSGDVEPSVEDIETTQRLQKAGDILCVPLLDHLIIGGDTFISLKEDGCML